MPRLLYIGAGNPWKGGAGYLVRQSLFLGALNQVANLHVAMFDCPAESAPGNISQFTSLSAPVKTTSSRLKKILADQFNPLPRMMRDYDLSIPRQQVHALHPSTFDAVFSFRIDFGFFAGVLEHPRLILDIDDPEHIRSRRRLEALKVEADPRTERDLEKLKRFERQAVAQAQLAFVCQKNDQQGWERQPEVVPNCVTIPPDPVRHPSEPTVLFVGNCAGGAASPNVDAVLYFLGSIWPRIISAVPNAQFHLIGTASETVRHAMAGTPSAKLLGFVDDLAETYAKSSVSIAPIRYGTGTRIKILEAFAHACPVVSTILGAEGIDAAAGKEIELAATAHDFADQTIALLRDTARAELIGQASYALALRKYDVIAQQKILTARFEQFFRQTSIG